MSKNVLHISRIFSSQFKVSRRNITSICAVQNPFFQKYLLPYSCGYSIVRELSHHLLSQLSLQKLSHNALNDGCSTTYTHLRIIRSLTFIGIWFMLIVDIVNKNVGKPLMKPMTSVPDHFIPVDECFDVFAQPRIVKTLPAIGMKSDDEVFELNQLEFGTRMR